MNNDKIKKLEQFRKTKVVPYDSEWAVWYAGDMTYSIDFKEAMDKVGV